MKGRQRMFSSKTALRGFCILVGLMIVSQPCFGAFTGDPGGNTPAGPGTTYYVSSTQGSDSNDGLSLATPWRTLTQVSREAFYPGDTILFKRGDVWRESSEGILGVTSSGNAAAPLVYGAYGTGNRPRIEGRVAASSSGTAAITEGVSWVTIDRLHFHDGPNIRILSSQYIVLQNSELSHRERACLNVREESTEVLIENVEIHDCGFLSNGQTKKASGINGEGIYVGQAGSKAIDTTGHITIRGNNIYDTTDEGINIKENTHDILIEENEVHDLTTSDPGGINLRPLVAQNHIVRNNLVHHIQGHPDSGSRVGTGIVSGQGSLIYNNVVFANQHYGIRAMMDARVYHNTLYGNGSGPIDLAGSNTDIRNNIGPTSAQNMAASSTLFVDAAGADFHLREGAAAIDAGPHVGIDVDLEGTPRPQGPGYDLGAYEYGGFNPPDAPILTFSASPSSILSGDSATVTWATQNASLCTASGGWSGEKALSGSDTVSPALSTSYILTCQGDSGSATETVTVTVNPSDQEEQVIRDATFAGDSGNLTTLNREAQNLWDGDIMTGDGSTGAQGIASFFVDFDLGQGRDLTRARLFGDNQGTWVCNTWQLQHKAALQDNWTEGLSLSCADRKWHEGLLKASARFVRVTVQGESGGTQAFELEVYALNVPSDIVPPQRPKALRIIK